MTVLGSNNLKQVNRTVAEVFGLALADRNNVWQKVYNDKTPTRKDEKTTIIKLDNSVTEATDGGAFTQNSIVELGDYTITQKIFKDEITMGDFAETFDNFGKIKAAAMEKGIDYTYKQDVLGVAPFNNPTSTSDPYGFIVDGTSTAISLLGNSQPVGDTGSTQDNLLSGGLSKSTLQECVTALVKMKRHNGNIAGYQARRIIGPVEEWMNMWQLTYSPMEPEGAENNRNWVNSLGIEPIVWDLLSSTTQCYLMASKMQTPHMLYYFGQKPQMQVIRKESTGNITYQFKQMMMCGIGDYQGVVGIS